MEYTFLIISAVVIITCVYFVISPFFAKEEVVADGMNSASKGKTIEAIYGAVNELEMDFLMKKISEDDFTEMKNKYQSMAAELLSKEREIGANSKQKHQSEDEIDEELLKELEAMRRSKERGKQ